MYGVVVAVTGGSENRTVVADAEECEYEEEYGEDKHAKDWVLFEANATAAASMGM